MTACSVNEAGAQPLEKVAPYPKAEKGMKRQVIQLTPEK
ncbi:ecotin, partial [Escherichia coli]